MQTMMRAVAGTLLVLMVAIVALYEAPSIERAWLPILDIHSESVQIVPSTDDPDSKEASFILAGTKLRSCELDSYSVGWRYDHSILPTVLLDDSGKTMVIPNGIQAGEQFALPFRVPVPSTALKAINPRILITYYYNCHGLYLTEQDLTIPVELGGT